jgi:hypothetical protein
MRRMVEIIIVVGMVSLFAGDAGTAKSNWHAVVIADPAIKMRIAPSKSAKVTTKILFGSVVAVVKESKKEVTVDGKNGCWHYVRWKGMEGYCFSEYMIFMKPVARVTGLPRKIDGIYNRGKGCSGCTYSHFREKLTMSDGIATLVNNGSVRHDCVRKDPANSSKFGATYSRVKTGIYTIYRELITIYFDEYHHGLKPKDECVDTEKKYTYKKIRDRYQLFPVQCQGTFGFIVKVPRKKYGIFYVERSCK